MDVHLSLLGINLIFAILTLIALLVCLDLAAHTHLAFPLHRERFLTDVVSVRTVSLVPLISTSPRISLSLVLVSSKDKRFVVQFHTSSASSKVMNVDSDIFIE